MFPALIFVPALLADVQTSAFYSAWGRLHGWLLCFFMLSVIDVQVVLRDVPQCNCSPPRLQKLGFFCSERCSVGLGLVSEGGLDWLLRRQWALASVRVVTKNALRAHVRANNTRLHSCSTSSHLCRPLSHPLTSGGQCVRLIASQLEKEKVTECHASVFVLQ